jgi:hypothetical protein
MIVAVLCYECLYNAFYLCSSKFLGPPKKRRTGCGHRPLVYIEVRASKLRFLPPSEACAVMTGANLKTSTTFGVNNSLRCLFLPVLVPQRIKSVPSGYPDFGRVRINLNLSCSI